MEISTVIIDHLEWKPVDNYGRCGIMENSTVIIDHLEWKPVDNYSTDFHYPTPTVMSLLQPPFDHQALSALLYKNVIITTLPSGQYKLFRPQATLLRPCDAL